MVKEQENPFNPCQNKYDESRNRKKKDVCDYIAP